MLEDYRAWLESELKLLGNASHHAYSLGQANMAKRAIERLDEELAGKTPVTLDRTTAQRALLAFEALTEAGTTLDPALAALRDALKEARPLRT